MTWRGGAAQERVGVEPNIRHTALLQDLFDRGVRLLLAEMPSVLDGSAAGRAVPQARPRPIARAPKPPSAQAHKRPNAQSPKGPNAQRASAQRALLATALVRHVITL